VTAIFGGQNLNIFDTCNFQPIGDPCSSMLDVIRMLRQT